MFLFSYKQASVFLILIFFFHFEAREREPWAVEGEVKIVKKTRWGERFKDVNTAKSSDGQRGSYFIKYCLRSFPQISEVCGKRKVLVSSQRKSPPITLFCRHAKSYPPTFQWCFQLLQRQRQSLFHTLQHCIIWLPWPFWSLGFEKDEAGCFRGTLFPLWSLLLYSVPSDSSWSFSFSVVLAPGPDQVSILSSRIWETFLGDGETLASLPLYLGPWATAWDCLRASLLHQAAQPFP